MKFQPTPPYTVSIGAEVGSGDRLLMVKDATGDELVVPIPEADRARVAGGILGGLEIAREIPDGARRMATSLKEKAGGR